MRFLTARQVDIWPGRSDDPKMTQRTIVSLVDDLDGSEASSTVSLGLDSRLYELDLSERNKAKLDKALAPYIAAARKVGGRSVNRPNTSGSRPDLQEIRQWASEQGYSVAERGRISADVIAAFDAR